jgi:hypothetical protein
MRIQPPIAIAKLLWKTRSPCSTSPHRANNGTNSPAALLRQVAASIELAGQASTRIFQRLGAVRLNRNSSRRVERVFRPQGALLPAHLAPKIGKTRNDDRQRIDCYDRRVGRSAGLCRISQTCANRVAFGVAVLTVIGRVERTGLLEPLDFLTILRRSLDRRFFIIPSGHSVVALAERPGSKIAKGSFAGWLCPAIGIPGSHASSAILAGGRQRWAARATSAALMCASASP